MVVDGETYGIDGVDQWPAITGANRTNPRPFILTTSTALLWDNDGTLYKAYIGARRNFWYDGKMMMLSLLV